MDYCTVSDIIALARPLDQDEIDRAQELIPVVCSRLRVEAKRHGYDLDQMVETDPDLAQVAKSVTVDIVVRCLASPVNDQSAAMSQISESALGYSISGTLANPGGGVFIKRSELAALGIRRQKVGVLEFYGDDD